VLVLDEADRLLDLGFADQLANILSYLPSDRQTLLFSATQTRKTKDLARLSMKDPEFVSCFPEGKEMTPKALKQAYVVCELHNKLQAVLDFLQHHCELRTICFFSSCQQVSRAVLCIQLCVIYICVLLDCVFM
jgi:ATP-dependent RNA helicase DDX10/DBP4